MPHARPMPAIGTRCYELRINDRGSAWRIMYAVASDAIVVLDVYQKKTRRTPRGVIDRCRKRLKRYEREQR